MCVRVGVHVAVVEAGVGVMVVCIQVVVVVVVGAGVGELVGAVGFLSSDIQELDEALARIKQATGIERVPAHRHHCANFGRVQGRRHHLHAPPLVVAVAVGVVEITVAWKLIPVSVMCPLPSLVDVPHEESHRLGTALVVAGGYVVGTIGAESHGFHARVQRGPVSIDARVGIGVEALDHPWSVARDTR